MGKLKQYDRDVVAAERNSYRGSSEPVAVKSEVKQPDTIRNACVTCMHMTGDPTVGTSKLVCMHDQAAEDVKDYVGGTWAIRHPLCEAARAPSGPCQPEGRLYQERKE